MKARLLALLASLVELPAEEIPSVLAVGLAFGVFPMVGVPTFLCLAAAIRLRLNAAALQVINSVTTPLQLALLLPFERAGAWAFGGAATSVAGKLGLAALHAVAGWACVCVPFLLLVCAGLRAWRHQGCAGPAQ